MKRLSFITAAALAGVLGMAGSANAATSIAGKTTNVVSGETYSFTSVDSQAWYNVNFGNNGWTHFGRWGNFTARRGQLVTVTVQMPTSGQHPGVSVWWRNTGPLTLPIGYYQGHSYNQYDDIKTGMLSDDNTGAELGYLEMIKAANGYDDDGVIPANCPGTGGNHINRALNPINDGVPGLVVLTFRAPRNGQYQLAAGGTCPGIDPATGKQYAGRAWPMNYSVDIR